MKKFCTRCGRQFEAIGREVICPSCKAQAAEDAKRAAVLKAKRASWTGESVPVRISGRASTVIRWFAESQTMTFAEALDTLLRTSEYFAAKGVRWEDVEPYKSHRRDKATRTPDTPDKPEAQDTPEAPQASKQAAKAQDAQDVPQAAQAAKASKPQDVQTAQDVTSKPQAAKVASKASASKANKTAKE